MKIQITQGHLHCPVNTIDAIHDIFINDGKIVGIGAVADFTADKTIDAKGKQIIPGLIDLNARCQEPGFEQKGTIQSESYAASANGVTTICCPPDTLPTIDTPAVVELILERAKKVHAKIYPIGAMTTPLGSGTLSEISALKNAGCFLIGNASMPINDSHVLRRAFEYAATFDMTLIYQAQDDTLAPHGKVHEGLTSSRLGMPGIPGCAESIAVSRALLLQRHTGVRLHFTCLSSAESVSLIADAKQRGQRVTADVAIHHLYLTDNDIQGFDSNYHVAPPLRSFEDQVALLNGLQSGAIDAICSAHTPHESTSKQVPFLESAPGMANFDSFFGLWLNLRHKLSLTFTELLRLVTQNPAKILRQSQGKLEVGCPADIVIYNPHESWQLNETDMLSQGKNSPFIGWPLQGRVHTTFINGHITYDRENTQRNQ